MVSHAGLQVHEAADYLLQLADLVEETGLTASDVGNVLLDVFSKSPLEQPADVQQNATEMSDSQIDSAAFARGLREQARQLRELGVESLPI